MANNYSYLDGMSTSELKERKNQNSADWHTDPWQRKNYEAENKAIMSILDQREGTKSTFDSGTGKWNTTGGSSSGSGSSGSGSSSGVTRYKDSSSGGSYSGGSSGSSSGGGASGSPYREYTGGDAELDAAVAPYKAKYEEGRRLAMAGDPKGVQMMIDANNGANQERNKRGYAAQSADEDIAKMRARTDGSWGSSGGSGGSYAGIVQQGYTQADLDAAVAAEREKQKQQSEYDLSEYIKKQKAAELESQLAGLKGAYEQSVAELRSAQNKLPGAYEDARNSAAAQAALAKRRFLEGAAYQGLGSGTAGQAELTHGATLTGTLSQIDRAQADSQAELDLEEATLASRYQQAIQQARANEDSEMATALYQELVRLQGLEREDKQLAQVQEQLLYNQKKAEEALTYEKEQAARTEAQKRVDAYLAALGKSADLDQDLIAQSGYTQGELNALERYYAQLIGLEEKYTDIPESIWADQYSKIGSGESKSLQVPSDKKLDWRSVDDWVRLYGEDAAENYIKENYKTLGYTSQSTALAGWDNYRRDSEYKDMIDFLAQMREEGKSANEINSFLIEMVNAGIISQQQKMELQKAYIGSGR